MFWENFSYLCTKAGVSPNHVVKELGIKSTGTVSAWKKGAIPRITTLDKIAGYFGVTVSELTGNSSDKEIKPTLRRESELERNCSVEFTGLSSEEEVSLRAFYAGLIAARKP